MDPREKLPLEYYEFLDVFNHDEADTLPPHRPGVDHHIELQKENGKDPEVPWGPLYSMS